jgi:hypothetical protein
MEKWKDTEKEKLENMKESMSRWAYRRAKASIESERDWGIKGNRSYFTQDQERLFLQFILHQQTRNIAYTYRQIETLVCFFFLIYIFQIFHPSGV